MKKTLAEHLGFASRLFDVGEFVKAGQIWQAILKRDPSNAAATSGLLRVKDAMGGEVPDSRMRPPRGEPSRTAGTGFEAFLREGRSLYDRGDLRGALAAWERALALDPGHALVLSYVRGARRELGLPASEAPPIPASSPKADEVARLLESGAQAFEKGRFEKAKQFWEKAHRLDPGNGVTKGYLNLVRNEVSRSAPSQPVAVPGRALVKVASGPRPRPPREGHEDRSPRMGSGRGGAATVPMAVTDGRSPNRRIEFKKKNTSKLLGLLVGSNLAAWSIAALIASTALVYAFRIIRKDALLEAVRADTRESAIMRAGESTKVECLAPTAVELSREARSQLISDPLRAFLLAHEVMRMDGMDASVPKLMDDARRVMLEQPVPQGNSARLMASGDLDGAAALLEGQLRRNPNDTKARESLARVSLLMARDCAANGDWEGARSRILLGSALFPSDLEWQARLRLLDFLRSAPEDVRGRWIGLLG